MTLLVLEVGWFSTMYIYMVNSDRIHRDDVIAHKRFLKQTACSWVFQKRKLWIGLKSIAAVQPVPLLALVSAGDVQKERETKVQIFMFLQ